MARKAAYAGWSRPVAVYRVVCQSLPQHHNTSVRVGLFGMQGVPCVQAVGEAEAMCAALNVCGWAHAVHTADVDALLFGALTVYRQMHLQVRRTSTGCALHADRWLQEQQQLGQ